MTGQAFFLPGVGGFGEGHACTSFSLQKRVVAAVVWWNITVQNKTVFGRQPQPTALDTTGLGRGWGSHYWTSERDTFVKGDLSCRHCLHTGGIMLYLSYCLNMLYYLIRRYLGQDFCRVWNIAQNSEGCAKMIPALIVGACERVVVENSPNFKMLVRPSHIFLQMRVKDFPAKIQLSSASV